MPDRDSGGASQYSAAAIRRWWPMLAGVAVVLIVVLFGINREDESTPAPTPVPAVTPPADGPRLQLPVDGKQAVEGTVTLYGLGGQTLVVLDLDGSAAPGAARLRGGGCGEASGLEEWLLAGVGDDGTSSTVVDVPLGALFAGGYVVDLPRADLDSDAEVCVVVAGQPVNAMGTPVDLVGSDLGGTRGTSGDGTGGSILGSGGATPESEVTSETAASPMASPVASPVPGSTPLPAHGEAREGTPAG